MKGDDPAAQIRGFEEVFEPLGLTALAMLVGVKLLLAATAALALHASRVKAPSARSNKATAFAPLWALP
jgi:hypothetical protein